MIKETTKGSVPWWPPRIVPPRDAPNILLVLVDDSGFGTSSTFGGVIPSPTLDKLAANGLRYTAMHNTALCSPTRAALITGRNHHSVGYGVVAEGATGFPGYDAIIRKDKATIGTILEDNGYATFWFGKDHNTPEWVASEVGPFDMWPSGEPANLPEWDALSDEDKKMFIKQVEVFAAYHAYNDYETGRVIAEIARQGKLDNTLIIWLQGDNGNDAEGTVLGTPNDYAAYNGVDIPVKDQMAFYDRWGGPETAPHMSVGWTWAFDTPYKWTKQVASYFGGTRSGVVISWPARIKEKGGIRNQFHHVIDVVPTILEATGIPAPEYVDGIKQAPIEGVSMAYTFDKANAEAPTRHHTQYFEMIGERGIYHDGWYANTTVAIAPWNNNPGTKLPNVLDYQWELYDLTKDWTQFEDVAAKYPRKLEKMQKLFDEEARKYQVLPLDNEGFERFLQPRPSGSPGMTEFTYDGPISIAKGAMPPYVARDFRITADIDVPQGGAEGMLMTEGGRFDGWGLYLLKGKPVFTYNLLDLRRFRWEGAQPLEPGRHRIVFGFDYDGPGLAKGGTGVLTVDGAEVAKQTIAHTVAAVATLDEWMDIGYDTRTGVDDGDYQPPFRFTGTIDKITFKPGLPEMTTEQMKQAAEMSARGRD